MVASDNPAPTDPLIDGPLDLHWVRTHLRGMSREQFLKNYPNPGLLLTHSSEAELTSSKADETTQAPTIKGMQQRDMLKDVGLVLVVKRPRNTLLPLMITVGRSDNVDIALNFPTVSKLHAFFYQVGNDWVVVDAGSSNGTFVEGLKLKAREPHTLVSNQNLHFGYDVSARFLLPGALAEFLIT